MIIIVLRARLNREHGEAAITAAQQMSAHALAEPGCQDYRFWIGADDPDSVLLFEQWENEESLAAHMASPELAAFAGSLGPALAGGVDATKFEIASSGPLF